MAVPKRRKSRLKKKFKYSTKPMSSFLLFSNNVVKIKLNKIIFTI